MTVQLYLAPASGGKTSYALHLVRRAAQGLGATPRVLVPSHLGVRAWRRRLAETGGAIGARLLTFDRLYAECLGAAGETYTELSEPVRYRLIRALLDELPLVHYAPLRERPGFVQVLEGLIAELKAARVWPETLAQAVAALGDEPRLSELALAYSAYQARLQSQGWADRAGLGWLAVEALEERAPQVARDWPLLVVDGFDDFTPVQLALLRILAGRVANLTVTLTGAPGGDERPLVHRRFNRTRQRLEAALGVQGVPLPEPACHHHPALAHLEAGLFDPQAPPVEAAGAVELIQAPDRAAEVRAGLRWLKARLVSDELHPHQVALLARSVEPYRPFIQQTAAEFGLPIRLVDGLPLRANPAVAALLDLLRLSLPRQDREDGPALPRRLVVEAWRSPYFDWSARPLAEVRTPIGIGAGDAERLDAAARWGRVIGGRAQWEAALTHLAGRSPNGADEDEVGLTPGVPTGEAAHALLTRFRRFVQRLSPPQGRRPYRAFVGWLEALIGPDPDLASPRHSLPAEPTALQVVARARDAAEPIAERDVAALQALKDVLRGLVWAEEALESGELIDYPRFFDELLGAVEASGYHLPVRPEREEILVADVVQARGLPFRAVALLGLAEGEFPATLGEDPFLRDADRARLREEFGLRLEPSTESAEAGFFYEAITRPRERLLLVRPRLADNGAPWQASPYWEEVTRLVDARPQTLSSERPPIPDQAASWPELMESLADRHDPGYEPARDWARGEQPARWAALEAAADLVALRSRAPEETPSPAPYDGDLSAVGDMFARRLGPDRAWSASRLEAYRTCPFFFFVGRLLGLEPRAEPVEGLDARQLGNIYHQVLEEVYQAVSDPGDLAQLQSTLKEVATAVLDAAPEKEGFRQTAWWDQTRQEILQNLKLSLEMLADIQEDWVPWAHEAPFGLGDQPALIVSDGADQFRLRGLIDRVDRAPDGRVRVIDYKTAGPYAYTNKALTDGTKIQLPLYALAARDALNLGRPTDGFYWHVQHAEPSSFSLAKFGPDEAIETAVAHAWEAVRGARRGYFAPQPPGEGCPSYCPAAGFCWRYRPGWGG